MFTKPTFSDAEVAAMEKWLPKDDSPFVCESCSDAFPSVGTDEQIRTGVSVKRGGILAISLEGDGYKIEPVFGELKPAEVGAS